MFDKINKLSLKVFSGCNFNCVFCHQLLDDKHKPFTFEEYKKLEDFLYSIPLSEYVDITITGGEITLAEDELLKTIKVLKKIERQKDVKFDICIISNGSKMDKIYNWIEHNYIVPHKLAISWDGIYNSLSRKSNISNDYYLNEIKKIGQSKYSDRISFVHSINPQNIDYLYDSFKFCYDNNVMNIGYYFIHEANYENLLDKFKIQIEKIAQMVVDYNNQGKDIKYYNWQNIYTSRLNKKNFFLCNKLGNNYHIDMFGDIYPCLYFGDHRTYKLGDLTNGLNKEMLKKFEDEYLRFPKCNYKNCKCFQCAECPGSNYVHNHNLGYRFQNLCKIHQIENEIFDKYSPMLKYNNLYIPNDVHNNVNFDNIKECLECEEDISGIYSPHYDQVKNW